MYIWWMSFSCKKGEFDRRFNRLDQTVEKSRRASRPDQFLSLDIKNKLTLKKIRSSTMGISPKMGFPKFKLFNLLSYTHEIFKVSQYEGKAKLVGSQMRAPPNGLRKFKLFYHSR